LGVVSPADMKTAWATSIQVKLFSSFGLYFILKSKVKKIEQIKDLHLN
jgi:hypothetical protein